MKKTNKCYFNNRIIPCDKILINPCDIGILRGYAVFDVMRTQNNKPFLMEQHFKRLKNSASKLNLKVPFNKQEYKKIILNLIKLNRSSAEELNIRTVLTGGVSQDAFSISSKPTFFILINKFIPLPKEVYQKGAKAIIINYKRHIPEAKTTNYIEAIRNQKIKNKNNALEIIYFENGKVLEASTSNLFIVKNNKIITPKDSVLQGITRRLAIKLAKKNFKVEEREILTEELKNADEVFLTATNKDIVPIINIDGKKINNGNVGDITKFLMNSLEKFLINY